MLYNVVVIDKCCCWQVLWIIPNEAVRWFSIVVALCLSGSILVLTFWPAVRDDQPRVAIAIMTAIVALHILLAFGCKVNIPGKKHTWAVFIRAQCSKTFLNVVHHGKTKWVFLIGQVQTAFFFFSCLVNTTPALRSWVVPGHVIQCPDLTIIDLTDPVYITSPGCTNGSISKWDPHNDLISSVTYSLFYWSLVAWQLPERYTTDHSIFGYTPSWQRMKGVKLVSLSQGKEGRRVWAGRKGGGWRRLLFRNNDWLENGQSFHFDVWLQPASYSGESHVPGSFHEMGAFLDMQTSKKKNDISFNIQLHGGYV